MAPLTKPPNHTYPATRSEHPDNRAACQGRAAAKTQRRSDSHLWAGGVQVDPKPDQQLDHGRAPVYGPEQRQVACPVDVVWVRAGAQQRLGALQPSGVAAVEARGTIRGGIPTGLRRPATGWGTAAGAPGAWAGRCCPTASGCHVFQSFKGRMLETWAAPAPVARNHERCVALGALVGRAKDEVDISTCTGVVRRTILY
jgi:hypothetical protein